MAIMFYDPATRGWNRSYAEGRIAIPGASFLEVMEDMRFGKPLECLEDGTPKIVADVLTQAGLRDAVFRELRGERALILNALTGVGYDALRLTQSGNPTLAAQGAAIAAAVDHARLFLRNITSDPDILAVAPGPQAALTMRDLILAKWIAYAAAAPSIIRAAFAEIA